MLLVVCLLWWGSSFAAELEPTDPAAATPPVKYQSVFEGYRSYREEPIVDWRALNEEVGRVGGHVGIFRGTGGHAGHGAPKPTADKPAAVQPQTAAPAAAEGQPPVRGAPHAPAAAGH